MRRLMAEFRLALSVGAVCGFLLGVRESLLTVEASAFAQPGQYLWLFLSVPILAWIGLGILVVLPFAALAALRPRAAHSSLAIYAATLAAVGTLSVILPQAANTIARLHEVGVAVGTGVLIVLAGAAIVLAGAAGAVIATVARVYGEQILRALRYTTWGVLAIALAAAWPPVRFLMTDWKRGDGPTPAAGARAADLPNVLLISIDTLRADHLGAYGDPHELTPHMDQLAADGVLFERAVTASPWTLPAVASLLTAQYPRHHRAGMMTNRRDPMGRSALPAGTWTLAVALHALGYRTHAIVTNPYLALSFGFGEGFDSYQNVSIESEAWLAFARTTPVRLLTWLWPDLMVGDRGETVSRRAQRWLSAHAHAHAAPFFLWLHYVDPHPPYSRPGATRHKSFRGDTLLGSGTAETAPFPLTSPDVARLRSGEIRLSPEQKDTVRSLYRAEVASVDAAVGVVLDTLDALQLREHTLVVLVADHGEEFWEHGGVEHGHTVYEEVIRIPLLVRLPGRLPAGKRIRGLVRITDVAPTIVELLGQPAPPSDGESLMPRLRIDAPAQQPALIENMLFAEERVGLRTDLHKYVRWDTGKEEIYALSDDPQERRDLVAKPDLLSALQLLYSASADGVRLNHEPGAQPQLDAATLEALRTLGYLQ